MRCGCGRMTGQPIVGRCGCGRMTGQPVVGRCGCGRMTGQPVVGRCGCGRMTGHPVVGRCGCGRMTGQLVVGRCGCGHMTGQPVVGRCDSSKKLIFAPPNPGFRCNMGADTKRLGAESTKMPDSHPNCPEDEIPIGTIQPETACSCLYLDNHPLTGLRERS